MNRKIMKLVCVLIGMSLGCTSLMGQNAKVLQDELDQKWKRQRNSFVLSTGPSLPVYLFGGKDKLPLVGKGDGFALTGRVFELRYSRYIDEGFFFIASLEHKYYGVDYGSYNKELNMDPKSPVKGSSVSFPGKTGLWSEGWNISALSVGSTYKYGLSRRLYFEATLLFGGANSYIPAISISAAGDDGKYADFITMDSENKLSFYSKSMISLTYLLSESVFLSFDFASTNDLEPSFKGHDFTFNEDGSRTPRKTNYSMESLDFRVGIGYSF